MTGTDACRSILRARPAVAGVDLRSAMADLESQIVPLELPDDVRERVRHAVVEEEERMRADFLLSGLKLDRNQLGDFYEVIEMIARRVDVRMPQVFVSAHSAFNAEMATIEGRGVLTLSPQILEVSAESFIAVVSHELGHLYLDHTFTSVAERKLFELITRTDPPPEGARELAMRLRSNAQLRELAADRISLFVIHNWEDVARALLTVALQSETLAARVDVATYIDEHIGSLQFNAHAPFLRAMQTHPAIAVRLQALRAYDPELQRILNSNSIQFL